MPAAGPGLLLARLRYGHRIQCCPLCMGPGLLIASITLGELNVTSCRSLQLA
jgi:hypothetical protein